MDFPQVSIPDVDAPVATGRSPAPSETPPARRKPAAATDRAKPPKPRGAKQFWLKQLHAWHWISAAIAMIGMLGFAVTGITLNHAATIGAKPRVVAGEAQLPRSALGLLARHADQGPLPPAVAAEVKSLVAIDVGGIAAEWSPGEAYVAVPGPGSDAWVSIDLASGKITSEKTDRGWISFFNDLHKGRNSGTPWFWFIDLFAAACIVFTITGLLLLQLHARRRPMTWPLVALGALIPAILILFFLHV